MDTGQRTSSLVTATSSCQSSQRCLLALCPPTLFTLTLTCTRVDADYGRWTQVHVVCFTLLCRVKILSVTLAAGHNTIFNPLPIVLHRETMRDGFRVRELLTNSRSTEIKLMTLFIWPLEIYIGANLQRCLVCLLPPSPAPSRMVSLCSKVPACKDTT